jgi:hypothetical protein
MSNARRAALHLLNNEWSRGVWKHWLSNIFEPPVEPPMPASARPVSSAPANGTAQFSSAPQGKLVSCSDPKAGSTSEPPESGTAREVRRSELRARFEALSDRLMAVEDGLDTLLRRSAQRDKSERRSDQQAVEVIDNVALAAERQASVLEGLLNTVSRLEHAVSRLETGLTRVERALGDRNRRDSHFPGAVSQPPQRPSHFPESHSAPRDRAPNSTRTTDADDAEANEFSGINGYLSDVSLSTVMAMLELERHTGRLKVATDDGMLASFELSEGSVVSSRLSENDADPLQTLRTALCWKQGRFWFRQQAAEPPSFAPRSIGSLLLEATRQNDESFANVG